MSRKKDIDQLDCQILTELFKDSSITNKDLSEKLGLTPGPTLNRVNALRKKGYIKGYSITLDNNKLGLSLHEITFTISGNAKAEVALQVSKMDFVMDMVGIETEHLITSHVYRVSCLSPNEVELENMVLELRNIEHVAIVDVKEVRRVVFFKSHWSMKATF